MYRPLTRYIEIFSNGSCGAWSDQGLKYSLSVGRFKDAVYRFKRRHPELRGDEYRTVLEEQEIPFTANGLKNANVPELSGETILAMILSLLYADRYDKGILLRFLEEGIVQSWLKRLNELDQ